MLVTTTRRIKNLAAWGGGSLLAQAVLLGAFVGVIGGDPAYGRINTFVFAEALALFGVLLGLVTYSIAASFWAPVATARRSLVAGALFGIAFAFAFFLLGLREGNSMWLLACLACVFAVLSYAFAQRHAA